ncbi:MAG: UDP-N-acetylmuramate dehydrogenase [Ruminococcaceae bacterium]|nr:UDP-N-acetylmuramate dehydrogenase [Oscillospiraceae bacterium]
MLKQICAELQKRGDITCLQNASMDAYTSFQIGGPADLLLLPETIDGLIACRSLLQQAQIPTTIIGAGSNLLVADQGICGAVIRLAKPLSRITCEGNTLIAEAGVSLARLSAVALDASLSGLEFASGIPGTLGGAVYMNAGAYGGEMKDVVVETDYLDASGRQHTLVGEAHQFSYRSSAASGQDWILIRSRLSLVPGNPETIRATMQDLNGRRRDKQPLLYPSAGSTFKRPTGYYAAKLIEDAGLKGFSVGGAQVSEKHAGFVINTGGATAEDVRSLIKQVQEQVQQHFGVFLEPEVRFIGEFEE